MLTGAVLAYLLAGAADAQTFKVDKFDIKGDGATDYVTADARPDASSSPDRRT